MAVTDQVDLAGAGDGQNLLDLGEQLFTAHFGGIGSRHLSHEHLSAIGTQVLRDAIPVVNAQDAVKAEQTMDQHDGVLGLGVTRSHGGLRTSEDASNSQGGGEECFFHTCLSVVS